MKPKVLFVIAASLLIVDPLPGDEVLFSRDVLPILSDHCFQCHGPDAAAREADLRLDLETDAKRSGDGEFSIIAAGNPDESELILRITTDDVDTVMPPADSGKQLTDEQKSLLTRWIEQGALWEDHWAYQTVPKPELAFAKPRQAIDHFVNKRLGEQQIAPNPPVAPSTWLRRVSLDLIGLPPTLAEIERFKANSNFDRVVTRLLASDRYGERMAWDWLEAARYADTHGYQKDNVRTMWAWRDWVIDAFNDNMPYDQFTIEQLAGDLLPDATLDQQIATGFNRNHRINAEAGSIDEEFRTEYVIDRTDTVATVWMGMTAGCARCHDHKFDPLSQRQFYQLFAFFNNIEEKGSDGVAATSLPDLQIPVTGQEQELLRARQALQDAKKDLQDRSDQASGDFERWIIDQQEIQRSSNYWLLSTPELVSGTNPSSIFTTLEDESVLFGGANPLNDLHNVELAITTPLDLRRIRLEALPDESLTDGSLARSFDGDFLLSEVTLSVNGKRVSLVGATAEVELSEHGVSLAIDSDPLTGWSVGPKIRRPVAAMFELAEPSRLAQGDKLTVQLRYESREEQYMIGRFRISLGVGDSNRSEISSRSLAALTKGNRDTLQTIFRETAPQLSETRLVRDAAQQTVDQLIDSSKTRLMVMRERKGKPRVTHLLGRGLYDQPGEVVTAGVPSFLGLDLPDESAPNRLTLARWLVDPNHPLTARVAVNRIWQQVFGIGLVKTSEDFGLQGERPSHPELLDWLAADFIRGNWNVKRLIREMVLSDTYRRSAVVRPDLLDRDPENRLLARVSRHRLSAPMIRDQALFLSGLMTVQLGGPPVKPWQPNGLWQAVAGVNSNTTRYQSDTGPALFRRSLYTFWKRGMPPPNMVLFDAANHDPLGMSDRLDSSQRLHRRHFLASASQLGIGSMALHTLLTQQTSAVNPDTTSRGGAKAKHVIYMCQSGAPSQIDLFDHKPQLDKRFNEDLPESIRQGQRLTTMTSGQERFPIAPSIFPFEKHGQCGATVSSLMPHIASISDDLCYIKSMHTEAINHDPAITFLQTGSEQAGRPSFGSWLSYGLGSENDELPTFVVLISRGSGRPNCQPLYDRLWGSGFLPSSHQGVKFMSSGDPVLYLNDPPGVTRQGRRHNLDAIARLNKISFDDVGDPEINTRTAQYEMAYRMQMSVPAVVDFSDEPASTLKRYGPNVTTRGHYAYNCLMARRLIERDVRFVQLFHMGWDQHNSLPKQIRGQCRDTDQPTAALVEDLKDRGLLDETLVIWGGEFGRTVYSQGDLTSNNYGRDHHPHCFTMWFAGGGIKPGYTHGQTDDFSYNITEDPVHIHDLNATLLHQLGIDHERLTYRHQGRDYRLTDVHGTVVKELLA